jgi:hypothetical protein
MATAPALAIEQQPAAAAATIPVISSKEAMRAFSRQQRMAGKRLAFVPTMVSCVCWEQRQIRASACPTRRGGSTGGCGCGCGS